MLKTSPRSNFFPNFLEEVVSTISKSKFIKLTVFIDIPWLMARNALIAILVEVRKSIQPYGYSSYLVTVV